MFTLQPMTERVKNIREKYRNTRPKVCIARYKLVTEFYKENPQLQGLLKRALNFKNICEQLPVLINEGEVIVGWQATSYRACALYPEMSFSWFMKELRQGIIPTREADPYILDDADKEYLLKTGDFWTRNSLSAMCDEHVPVGYKNHVGNNVSFFGLKDTSMSPVGHFCSNFENVINKGFAAIRAEAEEKMSGLEAEGIYGESIYSYNFYRAVSIVCEGAIILAERYAKAAAKMAEAETEPVRKTELEKMAGCLNWIFKNPCRDFHEALQCIYLYQMCMCLDGQQHGLSYGRVDQYLGKFYDADIKAGRITPEYAQELMDLYFLKVAETNKIWPEGATKSGPGYTSGQLMTLGGVDKDGNDATNAVSFMMLQSSGRLILHDPPLALRIHRGTPGALWEAAIKTTIIAGGVPTFENDEIIVPTIMKRGIPVESARNYALIGCVENQVQAEEWACPGGNGTEAFWNMLQCYLLAINDGCNPLPWYDGDKKRRVGVPTGYLYEMETFDDVLEAVKKQIEFFVRWQVNNVNSYEYVASEFMPLPLVSCTYDSCMEIGRDVMKGGAKYNSTGSAGIAIGNLTDSLAVTKYMVFDKKLCTAKELYDAVISDWEGKEELRQFIINEAPHYGNADPYCDEIANWATDVYANAINSATGPRGKWAAGLFPVTAHVLYGQMTAASPDGRKAHTPLADGISPVQQMDKNGPTATLKSCSAIDHSKFRNGTLLNMRFHPTSVNNEEGRNKLRALTETYFDLGGMELQFNVVSADTMRSAQKDPEKYKDLVVRIAGFSAYFVEVYKDCQEDLIHRTELGL